MDQPDDDFQSTKSIDGPTEEFHPTKIFVHGRLNLWLGTEDCVVFLHIRLPDRPNESTRVAASGVLTTGPDVYKYRIPQGGAAQPSWPEERNHLYHEEKLRTGVVACKPTGKVYDHHGVYEIIDRG